MTTTQSRGFDASNFEVLGLSSQKCDLNLKLLAIVAPTQHLRNGSVRPIAISWAVVAFIAAVSSAVAASYENSHGQISDQLTVDHAQIVLSPEGRTAVGYLAVWNGTRHGANLVSVQSEAFGSILFHRTEVVDGIGYMRPIKGALLLPGHSELLMKPGGVHMMLSDPKSTLTAGDNVTLVLTFDDGARVETAAKLLATGERTVDHHHAEGDMVESE